MAETQVSPRFSAVLAELAAANPARSQALPVGEEPPVTRGRPQVGLELQAPQETQRPPREELAVQAWPVKAACLRPEARRALEVRRELKVRRALGALRVPGAWSKALQARRVRLTFHSPRARLVLKARGSPEALRALHPRAELRRPGALHLRVALRRPGLVCGRCVRRATCTRG